MISTAIWATACEGGGGTFQMGVSKERYCTYIHFAVIVSFSQQAGSPNSGGSQATASTSGRKRAVAAGGKSPDGRQRVRDVVAEGWGEVQEGWQRTEAQLGQFEGQVRRNGGSGNQARPDPRPATRDHQQRKTTWIEPADEYDEGYEDSDMAEGVDDFYSMGEEEDDEPNGSQTTRKEVWTEEEESNEDFLNYEDDEAPPPSRGAKETAAVGQKRRQEDEAAKKPAKTRTPVPSGGTRGRDKLLGGNGRKKESPGKEDKEKRTTLETDIPETRPMLEANMSPLEAGNSDKRPTVGPASGAKTTTTSDLVDSTVMANHRLEGVELREYTKWRRGEPNKVRVETSSVSTLPPPPPPLSALPSR